jgi:CCDC81-like prokaryotic HU domain 2/CCDC81-like prokaryotic HU domain 1
MQIDINTHLEKLLFLHDSLVIPGFGGFTAKLNSAQPDYNGNTVAPPSKTLTFSENLAVDDGLLVQDLVAAHGISNDDARKLIAEFVEKLQQQLNQREIVTLNGIGRLYKNYMQKIQFLPDVVNFHAGSYGLPTLQFSPIARSREVAETQPPVAPKTEPAYAMMPPPVAPPPAPPPPPYTPPPSVLTERPDRSRWYTALSLIFLLGSILLGFWWFQQQKPADPIAKANDKKEKSKDDPTGSVKYIPPSDDQRSKPLKEEKPVVKQTTPEKPAAEKTPPPPVPKATEKSGAAAERECILVAATLSNEENVERLLNLIRRNGLTVYHVTRNDAHQVGIRFNYSDPAEIDEKIEQLRKISKEKNIVVRKR